MWREKLNKISKWSILKQNSVPIIIFRLICIWVKNGSRATKFIFQLILFSIRPTIVIITIIRSTITIITIIITIIIIINNNIRVFCPRADLSLQTQEPRLQFCSKAGLPLQIQKQRMQFYYG